MYIEINTIENSWIASDPVLLIKTNEQIESFH